MFGSATPIFVFAHAVLGYHEEHEPYRTWALMTAETRHERILDVLRRRGYAGIDELVSRFEVTPQTIRRDLQELSTRGLLRRHHGGASIPSSTVNTDYAQRHIEQAAEKERIASAAAS